MEKRRIDAIARTLAQHRTRRDALKVLLGFGGAVELSTLARDTEAARRGFSGPTIPTSGGPGASGCATFQLICEREGIDPNQIIDYGCYKLCYNTERRLCEPCPDLYSECCDGQPDGPCGIRIAGNEFCPRD